MTNRHLIVRWVAVVAVLTATVTVAPAPVAAQSAPGGGLPIIDIDVDVAAADVGDVGDTLDDLLDNVAERLRELRAAERDLAAAEDDLRDTQAQVAETEGRIDELTLLSDEIVSGTFVNASGGVSFDTLATDSMSDLAMKQTLRRIRSDDDANILQELAEARDELEEQKETEETLAAEAELARDIAAAELADLEAAVDQQTEFLLAVEDRLERGDSEAFALESLDPDLADELRRDRDDLTRKLQDILDAREYEEALDALAEAREAAEREAARREAEREAAEREAAEEENQPPADIGAPSGSLSTVSCPAGGSITVDSSLASNLRSLLDAAASAGVQLCGGGYRDPQRQIELRQAHCGTSHYAIYEMPASQCSPPTARPGSSMHEQGLAIDFNCNGGGVISNHSSPCFIWLDNNAASYGLFNLASEPWHWSINGN